MPKQTPSIPNEVLLAKLGDRSALSDELWLIAAQVGMLLCRSQDQLAEDRKVGNPPAFKKEGGSVRYRLGTVRDLMMNAKEYKNTEQARSAAEYNRRGYSSFVFWAEHAAPSDLWPCLIHHRFGPIDFWESLKLGDQLSDEDRCEMLPNDDYRILRTIWNTQQTSITKKLSERRLDVPDAVSRLDFVDFLDTVERLSDRPTPLRITSSPFDRIYAPAHLTWIRQLLNCTGSERQELNTHAFAFLHETYICKASHWTIQDSIHILHNESVTPYTRLQNTDISPLHELIQSASSSAFSGTLPSTIDLRGQIVVKPRDILKWANKRGEVNPKIAQAIIDEKIGVVPLKKIGNHVDPLLDEFGVAWRNAAFAVMERVGKLTFKRVAQAIAKDPLLSQGYDVNAISKQLIPKKFISDGFDPRAISRLQ
jgi:hypothetical protein